MLRRQQASAIISAREKIVEGAVSMVRMALHKLSEEEIVEFQKRNKNIEYVIQPQISKFLILRYKTVSVLRVEKDSEIDLDTKDVFRYPIGTIHNQKVNLA